MLVQIAVAARLLLHRRGQRDQGRARHFQAAAARIRRTRRPAQARGPRRPLQSVRLHGDGQGHGGADAAGRHVQQGGLLCQPVIVRHSSSAPAS